MITVAGNIMHRPAGQFDLLLGVLSSDIAALYQLFFDLDEIGLIHGDIQRVADGFQIPDIIGGLLDQFRERFKGPFLFVISGEIFL